MGSGERWLSVFAGTLCAASNPECVGEVPEMLRLPLPDQDLVAVRRELRQDNRGIVTWIGELYNTSGEPSGSIFMSLVGMRVVASIRGAGGSWELHGDGEGGYVLRDAPNSRRLLPVGGRSSPRPDDTDPGVGEDTVHDTDLIPLDTDGPDPDHTGGDDTMSDTETTEQDPYTDTDDQHLEWEESWGSVLGKLPEAGATGGPLAGKTPVDIMVVLSTVARDELGGTFEDIWGWANNRVNETERVWINSGITTHIPRLVQVRQMHGMEDAVWTSGPLPTPRCNHKRGRARVSSGAAKVAQAYDTDEDTDSTTALDLRDKYRADYVVVGVKYKDGCPKSLGAAPESNPIAPNFSENSFGGMLVGAKATRAWTFSHEMGHVMGVSHDGNNGAHLVSGMRKNFPPTMRGGFYQAWRSLMRSGNGGTSAGCRIPAFSSSTSSSQCWYASTPPGAQANAPCSFFRLDDFGDCGGGGGGDISELSFTNTTPRNLYAAASDYLTSDVSATYTTSVIDATPLDIIAGFREPPAPDSLYDAPVITHAAPGSLTDLTNLTTTFGWSPSLLHDPILPYDLAHNPVYPFYLEIGTTFGGNNVYDDEVETSAYVSGSGRYEVPVSFATYGLDTPYFARLWTQVAENRWIYKDQVINQGDRLVSCNTVNSAAVPDGYESATCPTSGPTCTLTLDGTTSTSEVSCSLSASTTTETATHLTVAHGSTLHPASPYEAVIYGTAEDGTDICCMLAPDAYPLATIEINGSDLPDTLICDTTVGDEGLLSDISCELNGNDGGDVLNGGDGPDILHGDDGSDTLRGHGGDDELYGDAQADLLTPGAGDDLAAGGNGSDLIRAYLRAGTNTLEGGAGPDRICTLKANDTLDAGTHLGGGNPDQLYISEHADGAIPSPSQSKSNANTECGHLPTWDTGWAGSSCNYNLSSPPSGCPNNF